MNLIDKISAERNIPKVLILKNQKTVNSPFEFEKRRESIKTSLQEQEYGYIPEKPEHLTVDVKNTDRSFCAGKARHLTLTFKAQIGDSEFSFPVHASIPNRKGKLPTFIYIDSEDTVPSKFLPSEEIADRGFAVFSFFNGNICTDLPDKKDKLAKLYPRHKRKLSSPGKLALWAWAAMRVMDYVETLDFIDTERIAVIGHARLGISALIAGAFDERFKFVISNNSSLCGTSISRGRQGETLASLLQTRPDLFCPRFEKYAGNEDALPFDQHALLSLVAPRHLLVGVAREDVLCDPVSEFVSFCLASEVYEKIYKLTPITGMETIPESSCSLKGDRMLYYMRDGVSYLSRHDWQEYMNYIEKSNVFQKTKYF